MEIISKVKCHGGLLYRCKHMSQAVGNLEMKFSVYMPASAVVSPEKLVPQVYWLSGLTCTDENFVTKAGAFKKANELNLSLVIPDTSPRGANLPNETDSWDFGAGAGFYLNATQEPWSKHYRMYDYITKELFSLVNSNFNLDPLRCSVSGHSMGGHGAITIGLKNPQQYKSISAFAPICNPINVPWGKKAFTGYLGTDESTWKEYDSVELTKAYTGPNRHILIDQGSADSFLANQLKPETLQEACAHTGGKVTADVRMQPDYDHSYYFITTFIDEHLEFHAKHLH
eukprot:GDKI01012702.1.p1 GENE.GDKI01012702.1~~GDKI01012702.1.p1  ORF type:complete len:295 (-),score=70.57 GDKI01012702.1:193-1047(-)